MRDIVGPYQLASTAEYQGMIAGANVVLPVKKRVDYSNNVYVVFTEPRSDISDDGRRSRRKYSHKLKVLRFDYANMRRAMVDGTDTGLPSSFGRQGRLVGRISSERALRRLSMRPRSSRRSRRFEKALFRYPRLSHVCPGPCGKASQLAYLDRMSESILVKKSLVLFPGLQNRLDLARERLAETQRLPSISLSAEPLQDKAIEALDNDTGWVVRLPEILFDFNEEPVFTTLSGKDVRNRRSLVLDFCRVTAINGLGADMLIKLALEQP